MESFDLRGNFVTGLVYLVFVFIWRSSILAEINYDEIVIH